MTASNEFNGHRLSFAEKRLGHRLQLMFVVCETCPGTMLVAAISIDDYTGVHDWSLPRASENGNKQVSAFFGAESADKPYDDALVERFQPLDVGDSADLFNKCRVHCYGPTVNQPAFDTAAFLLGFDTSALEALRVYREPSQ